MKESRAQHAPITPGIILLKGARQLTRAWRSRLLASGALDRAVADLQHEDWLEAYLVAPRNTQNSIHRGNDGIEVLCDGYISDIVTGSSKLSPEATSADKIAELYRKQGDKFLPWLRGSYSALVIDKQRQTAFLFNDRRGSRPSFHTAIKAGTLIIAPESLIVAAANPDYPDVSRAGICEFLISGRNWSDHTLFNSIHKFPQASKLYLSKNKHLFSRYWHISFTNTHPETSYDALVEEATHLCQQSTQRLRTIIQNPFLFLSGGMDCRVVLSCLTHGSNSSRIPLVAYGNENGTDNDVSISKKIAKALDLPLEHYPIPLTDWPTDAQRASESNDCIVEAIDAPALIDTWSQLSGKYSSFFNGDECFGWRPPVTSTIDALNTNMMFTLNQVARLKDWIPPTSRRDIAQELNHTADGIINLHEHDNHTDLRDALYFEERLANEVNANVANQLKHFEQARPLLDEDFLDFVSRLPVQLRTSKQLYASIVEKLSPALSGIPLAKSMSIPLATTFSSLLAHDKRIAQFCLDELDNLSTTLDDFIETKKIRLIVEALQGSLPLPSITSNWLSQLPGAWRFTKASQNNRVHPVSLLIRLLQINFFLKNMANTRSRIHRTCT